MDRRRAAEWALMALGVLASAVGLLGAYFYDTVSDSEEFADRAITAYSDPLVREQITDAVVDQMVTAEPELVAVQPVLESIVTGALSADTTTNLVRAGVIDLHRTVLGDDEDTVTMQISGLILVAKTQLTALDPDAGALIPDDLTDALVMVSTEPVFVDALQTVDRLWWISVLLPLVGALAFVGVIWLAPSGSAGLVRVGSGLVGAGVLAALTERLARGVLIRSEGSSKDVARNIWDAFAGELGTWTITTVALGGILAAVAWFGVGELDPGRVGRALTPIVRRRTSKTGRIWWGVGALVVGGLLIVQWQLVVRFSVTLAGAAVVAAGVRELVSVLAPGLVEGASGDASEARDGADAPRRLLSGRWASTAAIVLLGAAAAFAVTRGGDSAVDAASDACNGDKTLCDRRLDEVVLPATHNSHAAADEGFLLGYHRRGIAEQLDDGVRALLIDVYFGREVDASVITDRAPLTDEERDELVLQIGDAAVRSAEATAARADESGVERELFLCHALCEIGATRFDVELGTIARFVDDNPGEVLVLIVQDEGPRPADVAEAFAVAGLADRLHTQALGAPWPTLGELIEADTPIVVFAENVAGDGFPWYHDAFDYTQDTPFSFESIDDFSCDLNRGEADNGLFLLNHWLSPASPTSAATVNEDDVITRRFEQCADERGQIPNIVAVDFYREGDTIEAVADLNER